MGLTVAYNGGAGGRPRTPTRIKMLHGTMRPDQVTEPEPPMLEIGEQPPGWVKGAKARRAWRELVKLLGDAKVLTVMDVLALGLLVDAFSDYLEAKRVIEKEGLFYAQVTDQNGIIKRAHPAVQVRDNAWARLERILGKFGMNPADRSRVKVATEKQQDPFESWASQQKGTA
jgi:P27 family predicted phage terminase small subunit